VTPVANEPKIVSFGLSSSDPLFFFASSLSFLVSENFLAFLRPNIEVISLVIPSFKTLLTFSSSLIFKSF